MCCTRLAEKYRKQKGRQKSTSGHHRTTLSGISSQLRHVSTVGKKLLRSNMSSRCPHNKVNFGPLAAEIVSLPQFGAPHQISTGFTSWQHDCTAYSSGRQPNFAALNRGHHLLSAEQPSRWALAHISSCVLFCVMRMCAKPAIFLHFAVQ